MEKFEIWINRVYANTKSYIGRLYANNEPQCFTLEKPWKDNQTDVSCAPVGCYPARIRPEGDGTLGWRIELLQVPGPRIGIELHVGNVPEETHGCVLLGLDWDENTVKFSADALKKLKNVYETAGSPSDITVRITGYP